MSLRAWVYALRDAFRSMTQSTLMSLASMATVAVSLLVLSVTLLLALNLDHWANTVEKQVVIRAYLCATDDEDAVCNKQELNGDQIKALMEQIKQMPGVVSVTFITKEEALKELEQQFEAHKGILAGLGDDNPLRNELRIEADDTKNVATIGEAVRGLKGVGNVNYGQDWVKDLIALTHAIRIGGAGLVLLLIIATVLTISNTIRLAVYARRREISIMKLVGATDWYIRRPFMVEGIFLGVFGALIAMALAGWGYQQAVVYLDQSIPFLPLVRPEAVLMNQTAGLTLLGAVLGAIGSLISMRRFLKV